MGITTFRVSDPMVRPATMKFRRENRLCDHRMKPVIIAHVLPERTAPSAITPSYFDEAPDHHVARRFCLSLNLII